MAHARAWLFVLVARLGKAEHVATVTPRLSGAWALVCGLRAYLE